jgi:hypothetical protein
MDDAPHRNLYCPVPFIVAVASIFVYFVPAVGIRMVRLLFVNVAFAPTVNGIELAPPVNVWVVTAPLEVRLADADTVSVEHVTADGSRSSIPPVLSYLIARDGITGVHALSI